MMTEILSMLEISRERRHCKVKDVIFWMGELLEQQRIVLVIVQASTNDRGGEKGLSTESVRYGVLVGKW